MSEQQIDTPRIDTIRLQSIARGFTETAVFYAAIDLDIFTHVSQGAATIEAVASAANITALNAERIVVVLLALGLIEKDDAGHLHNAPDCEKFMVSTSDRFARTMDDLHSAGGATVVRPHRHAARSNTSCGTRHVRRHDG